MIAQDPVLALIFEAFAFVTGACIGSFLNVLIYRIPAGQSIVTPRSHCKCGHWIAWYDNLPVLSWFLLRGRCRACGERFSIRYPAVELLTALLFWGLWDPTAIAASVCAWIMAGMLIAAAFIDIDTMEIPDRFSIGGFVVGCLCSVAVPGLHGFVDSGFVLVDGLAGGVEGLLGAFVGSGLILWLALVAEAILRKEAMGFGDVKLMGAIGAFCGWQGAVFALFGGAVLGLLGVVLGKLFVRSSAPTGRTDAAAADAVEIDESAAQRIPFGPALAAGALVYMLWMQAPVDAYFAGIWELMERLRG